MPNQKSYTGRHRRKKTRFSVRFADFASTRLITIGGIGTIVAVSLVAILLVAVVLPLFTTATLGTPVRAQPAWSGAPPVRVAIDEYRTMGWVLRGDGVLQVFRLDTGEEVTRRKLFDDDAKLTAASFITAESANQTGARNETLLSTALGFADGTVRIGTIGFRTTYRESVDAPETLQAMGIDEIAVMNDGVVQVTPQRQFRLLEVVSDMRPPVKLTESSIQLLGHAERGKGFALSALGDDGQLVFATARQRKNLDGDTVDKLGAAGVLEFPARGDSQPRHLLLPSRGDAVYLVWDDGHMARFDCLAPSSAKLAEELELLDDDGSQITVLQFALNRETLLVGDSHGRVRGWFPVDRNNAVALAGALPTADGKLFSPIHEMPSRGVAVTSLGISERSRMAAVGYADGHVRVYHVTTNQVVADAEVQPGERVTLVAIAPKDNGLVAATGSQLWNCDFDPGHPEASWASLFLPVWYEGYDEPDMLWQSSFAGVGPEMKLGLWPIVFGTLKATLYSMLFGAPLALLAAIYTSEFLQPRVKGVIKPLIEVMASLPSVVLGFLAALVFAPIVEDFVPMTLALFATLPLAMLVGAFLWQLLPQHVGLALQSYRFPFICTVIVPSGFFLAWCVGPLLEQWFFAGDIKLWLDGQLGTGTGAWMILVLPLTAILVTSLVATTLNTWLRQFSQGWSRRKFGLVNLAKFAAALIATFLVAWGFSALLTTLGFDPRGSYVGTYVQRNALVVGFVMGFAIIPIIYTIADDALSTVPQHLRSASLGAGATPWQTAMRIVVPTAMSGLFSALMIGLGRAVGETMIVLMAGGNTAVRDWNVFSGFRTLAANIAVELPEAVQNSTHYRTLFLAALVLFVMTFFVNTIAELVRLRFRKRAVQL